jgi:hypothetical protein
MAAVWMRFQTELRAGWQAWLTLAALAGLAGGLLLAAEAGARRTDSALARHLVAYRLPDVRVTVPNDAYARVGALPQVDAASVEVEVAFTARDRQNEPVLAAGPRAMSIQMGVDRLDTKELQAGKLLAGRHADPDRPNEALVDARAAETLGVEPRDKFHLRVFEGANVASSDAAAEAAASRIIELRVVGVAAATDTADHPGGVVRLTRALYRNLGFSAYSDHWMSVRLKHGAADLPAFRAGVERIHTGASVQSQQETSAKVQRSIHLQAQALWLAGAFGALLVLALVSQAFVRLAADAALAHPTLRAVGMTRRQLLALGIARTGAVAVLAALLAVGIAVALSPLAPIGLARELEPDPGLAIAPLAVGLGGAAVLVAVVLVGTFASWRTLTEQDVAVFPLSPPAASVVADALARRGLPQPVVTGVRLALSGRTGGTRVPFGATLLGAVLAVAVAATALTFSASLAHLFSTPRLYGQIADYRIVYGNDPFTGATYYLGSKENPLVPVGATDPQRLAKAVRSDPLIGDAAFGAAAGRVWLNHSGTWRLVGVRAMDDLKGRLEPVVIEGRAPLRSDEILLGATTFDAFGVELGDTIRVGTTRSDTVPMHIVGRGVIETGRDIELGEGAAMTFAAYEPIAPSSLEGCCHALEVRFKTGTGEPATLSRLQRPFVTPARGLPTTVADFGGVDRTPLVVSTFVVLIAAGALAHTLVMGVRRRKRHLAILKTLGFDRRQVVATVAWQSTTFAAFGLLFGLPLGVAAGRWAWNLFADELGVVPEPVTPGLLLLLVVPGAVLVATLVAAIPAGIASRTRPALVLRAE